MTIHWKAIEEHFLTVPLVFRFNHFRRENAFSEFFSKKPLKQLRWGKRCQALVVSGSPALRDHSKVADDIICRDNATLANSGKTIKF
jgi:hypothetical protein